jgi:predicted amidohydrolase YtcJ
VLDDQELRVLPAFFETHEHLLDSARNLGRVRLEDARSMNEPVANDRRAGTAHARA